MAKPINDKQRTDRRRPDPDDREWQKAVLTLLLAEFPILLTEAELARLMLDPEPSLGELDALARAMRDLYGAGLINRVGDFAIPSLAAHRIEQIRD